nr:hypothetical protein [uncultured Rhodopila sp.]
MTTPVSPPEISLGSGSAGDSAGLNTPPELQVLLQNLMTGAADIASIRGLKVLTIGAGAIGTAGSIQTGNTETAAEVAANLATLKSIAAYCEANGIVVQVDASLTNSATYSDGKNALVDQWATAAAEAALPISSVEDVGETAISESSSDFANTAIIEANALNTLIVDYKSSSYTLTARNLGVGDMEGGGATDIANIGAWVSALDGANAKLDLQNVSYVTADTSWFGPWIDPLSQPDWQAFLQAMSSYAASAKISLNVIIQGAETDLSGSLFVQQAEQLAVYLLQLQASGTVNAANLSVETWQIQPVGIGLISSPDSTVNLAAELTAVAPQYVNQKITASGTVTSSAPGQIIMNAGTAHSITGLSFRLSQADVLSGGRLGVVIIDQTGTLSASQIGSGTVSRIAGNILVLTGNASDLSAELATLSIYEANAGPDTVDVEAWGAQGRLSDDQIQVVATSGPNGGNLNSGNPQQGWLAAIDVFNTGTVQSSGSVLTSQTLYWSTTGTTAAGQPAFLKTDTIHEPLAEYGVENTPNGVRDVFDPSIDDGAYPSGGWANNPGVNNVGFANSGWNGSAFNAASQVTALVVSSTVKAFDSVTGRLLTSVDTLAPDSPTVIVHGTVVADTFANAFANGGRQVTIMNTGNNSAWQPGWGTQFSSAILTYDSAGKLVEELLQGGPGNRAFNIDNIYDPNSGQLWEQFQSTSPPPESSSGKYANTNNPYEPGFATGPLYELQEDLPGNPNWDGVDWGNQVAAATELWTDYFIQGVYPGFAVNLSPSAAGDLGSYPLQFVNGSILDLFGLRGSIAVNLNALGSVTIQSQTMKSRLSGLTEIDAWGSTGTVTITGLAGGRSTLIGGDGITTINGFGHDTIVAGAGFTTINTGSGSSTIQVTGASSAINLFGNGNTVTAVGGSTVNETGTGEVITFQSGGTLKQGAGSSAVVNGNAVVTWMYFSGGSVTAIGNNDTVTGGPGATISLSGNFDTAGSGAGSTVNVTGLGDVVYGNGIVINVGASNSSPLVFGYNDTITAVGGSTVTETGTGEVITFQSGGTLKQGAGSSAVVNGNAVVTWMYFSGGSVTATGNNDTVTGGPGATISLSGNFDTAGAGVGSTVNANGQGDIVYGSKIAINVGATANTALVFGNSDAITVATGKSLSLTGTGEIVNGSNLTIYIGPNSSGIFNGTNDVIAGTVSAQNAASVSQTVFMNSTVGGGTAYEKLSLSGSTEYVQIGNGNSLVVNDAVPASAIAASILLGAPRQMAFLSTASSNIQATVHPDEFVVLTPTPGASAAFTIGGFDATQDLIGLSYAAFGNAQQILADTKSVSGGASIASLNGSTHLLVAGVALNHLGAADFLSI